jgi:hypothetical protein
MYWLAPESGASGRIRARAELADRQRVELAVHG